MFWYKGTKKVFKNKPLFKNSYTELKKMSATGYSPISKKVAVEEKDFLDEDPPIRGQNFYVVSFVSPEEVIKQKEVVFFNKYITSFSTEMKNLLENIAAKSPENKSMIDVIKENYAYIFNQEELQEQFNFFKSVNSKTLEEDYLKENKFQTSVRGVKCRGAYDTMEEAENRIKFLKRNGCKFPIYAAMMGCWCPWSPNPDDVADAKYAETELNTIAGKLKENNANREAFFNERKENKIEYAKEDATRILEDVKNGVFDNADITRPNATEYDTLREQMQQKIQFSAKIEEVPPSGLEGMDNLVITDAAADAPAAAQ